VSKRLTVHRGIVSVPLRCSGASGALCKGSVTLSAVQRLGRRTHSVSCGAGTYVASAGHTRVVRSAIGTTCKTLLTAARSHKLGATFAATFSSHQRSLRIPVTLLG